MTTFTKLSDSTTETNLKFISELMVYGEPVHRPWPHFVGNGRIFRSGVWESTAGVFRGPMNDQIEFRHTIEGEAGIVTEGNQ